MNNSYTQRGENREYPMEIEAWRKSDNTNPPAWLSDKCKVLTIKSDGILELATRKYDDSSYEYISPELSPIVKVRSEEDWICLGDISKYEKNKMFSLTPRQFDLLYKKK